MLSFDPTMMNLYLDGVFSLAVIALALALGAATTEVTRRLRPTLTRTSATEVVAVPASSHYAGTK